MLLLYFTRARTPENLPDLKLYQKFCKINLINPSNSTSVPVTQPRIGYSASDTFTGHSDDIGHGQSIPRPFMAQSCGGDG